MDDFNHRGERLKIASEIGCFENELIDFSTNINPLGTPEWLRQCISACLESITCYADPACLKLKKHLASYHGVKVEEVVVGNGATQFIYMIPEVLGIKKALIPSPSCSTHTRAVNKQGIQIENVILDESRQFIPDMFELDLKARDRDLVFLGNPNHTTGVFLDVQSIVQVASKHSQCLFVIDESYIDFNPAAESFATRRLKNIIVLRSMTKFYALAGLRLGYAIGDKSLIEKLYNAMPPGTVNSLVQSVGVEALNDSDFRSKTCEVLSDLKKHLIEGLSKIRGVCVHEGGVNFLLMRIKSQTITALELYKRLLREKIVIRIWGTCTGLSPYYFRVAVLGQADNLKLIDALANIFQEPINRPLKKMTPALMFQGTASNVGKSILTAALCRILYQDGLSVAPFKSQNMSLNSYVTQDGKEMGRAQVLQARASHLEPDIRMNPVLLKPNTNKTSQVIVKGLPVGTMSFFDYIAGKKSLFRDVTECYDSLSLEHDVMVIEGAGSAGEVNLKSRDIVNMKMAKYAGAKVILVADIDLGGVFASLIGHMEVLTDWERKLVCGFLINRFRCDPHTLKEAVVYLERYTGRPVLGIIPHIEHLRLPEEDSVNFKPGFYTGSKKEKDGIDIVVIRLPMTSNFTDFDSLMIEEDVNIRLANHVDQIGNPDIIILPGSKNVIYDYRFMEKNGIASKIKQLAVSGKTEVIGICGGFQILGENIQDPLSIESHEGSVQALGLLKVSTLMAPHKKLSQTVGMYTDFNMTVSGYEIHHGETTCRGGRVCMTDQQGQVLGVSDHTGPIWGTYLHGIFDNDTFRDSFLQRARTRKGLSPVRKAVCYDLDEHLNNLANVVRKHINLDHIYKVLGL